MPQGGPEQGSLREREVGVSGRLFTTDQLGRMLDVPPRRVRGWVRAGLLVPVKTQRRAYFDFAQVTRAKTLLTLTRGGATTGRIQRSLQRLRSWLPEAQRSLLQLEVLERGAVLVRLEDGRLAEPSGQLRLPFERRGLAACASLRAPPPPTSGALFEAGIEAEAEGRLEAAVAAYEGALQQSAPQQSALPASGGKAEIAFNLGNVLYTLERAAEAVQRYQQAIEIEPCYPGAWNNLGNALSDLGRLEPATRAYQRCLQLDAGYVDAHFNLGATYRQLGRLDDARRHWQTYLALDPHSEWARQVRARLDELSV